MMQKYKKVAIFDSDGVLLDTIRLVDEILPKPLFKLKRFSLLWDIVRKMTILIGGDKICDERLQGISVETIKTVAEEFDIYVVTKRPFWLGGKKRLLRQLEFVYGGNFFDEKHVFSSCLSKHKGEVIRKKILQPNTEGFIVDDNGKNLEDIPGGIVRIWLDEHVRFGFHFYPLPFVTISDLRQLEEAITLLFP